MRFFNKTAASIFIFVIAAMLLAPAAFAAYSVKGTLYRISATAGEALATGNVVCIKSADGYAYKADANDADLRPAIGIVGSKTASASGDSVEIILVGVLTGWSSLTEGGNAYLSETAAAVTQSAPSWNQKIGFALNATDYFFSFQNYFDSSAVTAIGVLTGATPVILEGATADAHETTITPTDPTADQTLTLPDDSGAVVFSPGGSTTSIADSLAIPVTHACVAKTTGADAEALTLANGENGQILTIDLATDGGGTGTLTPATCSGFSTIVFADAGDNATLLYIDDSVGWIIMGAAGVAAPPAISD